MVDKVIPFDQELEEKVREEFGKEATPEFINMLRLGKAAYEHGFHGFIKKEKVLEWVSRLYDGGEEQQAIRQGKAHGGININSSDVISAGSHLSLHGEREGYLSKQEAPATNQELEQQKNNL
tara:strand:- start:339 stop:704 length:366 start_codon:yes stop_codon:yes gene_type:complete